MRFVNRVSIWFNKPCVQTIHLARNSSALPQTSLTWKYSPIAPQLGRSRQRTCTCRFGTSPLVKRQPTLPWQDPSRIQIVVLIDIERAFAGDGNNTRLPTTEVFLCTASGELAKSKKIRYWTDRNAVLLPTLLTDIVLPNGEYNIR